jgi:hypothetical protein
MKFDPDNVYRTTKCFTIGNNGYPGGFPTGFMDWIKKQGWWGDKRCYLCSGSIKDDTAITVDLNPDIHPSLLEDARHTSIPDEDRDWVLIDPPYSKELAKELYGLDDHWSSINDFTKEANRICKPGGLILTLSYEVPKTLKQCDLIVCCGIYQIMNTCYMRCFTVWKKRGNNGQKTFQF